MNLPPQTLLQSRYEIQEPVEQDAAGARYRGLDLRLGREVSIRTFPLPPPQANEDYRAMDTRMSQVVALRHPGIEIFLDMGFHQRLGIVVSEWAPGGHAGHLVQDGPLGEPQALGFLHHLLDILEVAHGQGVAHGRLCPSAVVPNPEGGLRLRSLSLGPTDLLAEDSPYRAPEGGTPSPGADFYACGVLLKDMVGPHPTPGTAALIQGLLDPDPERRIALVRDLRHRHAPVSPPAPPSPWWRSRRLALILGLALLVAAGWWTRPGHREQPEANAAYRRGRFSLARRTVVDFKKAEEAFLEALHLDPQEYRASSGLAITYALQGVHGAIPLEVARDKAQRAAQAALALQKDDGEATATLAYLAFRFDWEWDRADTLFKRAVAQDPANPLVRHWHGFYLSAAGRHREAVAELREALRLDPVDLQTMTNLGVAQAWGGDLEGGLATLRRVVDMDPRFRSAWDRIHLLLESHGRITEALGVHRTMAKAGMLEASALAALEKAFEDGGETGYLRARLGQLRPDALVVTAGLYVQLGMRDDAFQAIDTCVRNRDLYVVWIPGDPIYRPLHTDPRYRDFLRRIRYPGF